MDFIAANPKHRRQHHARPQGHRRHRRRRGARREPGGGRGREPDPRAAARRPGDGGRRVARPAGIPLIGFSNNSGAAAPGVYLLNVLPESEVKRSLGYAKKLRQAAFAGIFPNTDFGRIQEGAFRPGGRRPRPQRRGVYNFVAKPKRAPPSQQLAPLLQAGADRRAVHPRPRHRAELRRAARGGRHRRRAGPDHRLGRLERRRQHRQHALPRRARSTPRSTMPATRRCCTDYQAQVRRARRTRSRPSPIPPRSSPTPRRSSLRHAALRPRPAHHPRRLQRPRRRVPVPARRPQRIRAGDQAGDRRRRAGRRRTAKL